MAVPPIVVPAGAWLFSRSLPSSRRRMYCSARISPAASEAEHPATAAGSNWAIMWWRRSLRPHGGRACGCAAAMRRSSSRPRGGHALARPYAMRRLGLRLHGSSDIAWHAQAVDHTSTATRRQRGLRPRAVGGTTATRRLTSRPRGGRAPALFLATRRSVLRARGGGGARRPTELATGPMVAPCSTCASARHIAAAAMASDGPAATTGSA